MHILLTIIPIIRVRCSIINTRSENDCTYRVPDLPHALLGIAAEQSSANNPTS